MIAAPTPEELAAAHCWEHDDRVPGRPDVTDYRRLLRYHQARWRESHGHPIGSQPIVPRPGQQARLVGSRIPLEYGRETGATFLTEGALAAARRRTATVERHQSVDHQRLWADLLWSPALAVNLFGDLAADLDAATRAVRRCWSDVPGTVREVRFAHSPGWLDPAYLNSLRSFDAAFVLELDDGTRGIVAVDTKYHEWMKPETPKPSNLARYHEVARRSGVFVADALQAVSGRSALAEMWLEHLLLHSMLQHQSGNWTWGRYVVVRPAGNAAVAEACAHYASLLTDGATFATTTLEDLLDCGALPAPSVAALRERYVAD